MRPGARLGLRPDARLRSRLGSLGFAFGRKSGCALGFRLGVRPGVRLDRLTPCVVEVRGSLGSRLDPRSDARLRSRLGSRPDLRSRLGASLLLNRARVRAEAPEPSSCVPEKASRLLRIASHVRLAADFGHETEFWHGAVPKRATSFIATRHYADRCRRWAGKRRATARIPCQNAVSWPFSSRFAARAFYRTRGHADT